METRLFRTIVLFSATTLAASPFIGCSGAGTAPGADASVTGTHPTNDHPDGGGATDPLDSGPDDASPIVEVDASDADSPDASDAGLTDASEAGGDGGDPCALVDAGGIGECVWTQEAGSPPLACQPVVEDGGGVTGCVVVDAGWPSTK